MPELPDVEVFRRYLAASALHQRIERTHVESSSLLKGTTPQGLGRALKDASFQSARRHGKYLFAGTNRRSWLVLHFGMSGSLEYFDRSGPEPAYTQCLISFANGFALAYVSVRKLGRIALTDSPAEFIAELGLGPDALRLDEAQLTELAGAGRSSVKSWLMDQHRIAGIGNIYADEILFQAGIHPRRRLEDLDAHARRRLARTLPDVLEAAIAAGADPEQMPETFLLARRAEGARCPRCGHPLEHARVGGRTAWYCPSCQA